MEIDHNGWPDRPRIQKQIALLCATDPQHIFNVCDAEFTPEQKARAFDRWCPPPTPEETAIKYDVIIENIEALGGDASDWKKLRDEAVLNG